MKVIIAGSRGFHDYELLKTKCDGLLARYPDAVIISGGAGGADRLGERYALESHKKCLLVPAEWDKYGKRAGMIRNLEMAKMADALIAFWDGISRGTNNMIESAKKLGLQIRVVRY